MLLYFDSKTGNVARFIQKVMERTGWISVGVGEILPVMKPGHLVTFTTRNGELPQSTRDFLEQYAHYIRTVSSSGNRNWGENFGRAADVASEMFGIPVCLKFELSGFECDVDDFIRRISNYETLSSFGRE